MNISIPLPFYWQSRKRQETEKELIRAGFRLQYEKYERYQDEEIMTAIIYALSLLHHENPRKIERELLRYIKKANEGYGDPNRPKNPFMGRRGRK